MMLITQSLIKMTTITALMNQQSQVMIGIGHQEMRTVTCQMGSHITMKQKQVLQILAAKVNTVIIVAILTQKMSVVITYLELEVITVTILKIEQFT